MEATRRRSGHPTHQSFFHHTPVIMKNIFRILLFLLALIGIQGLQAQGSQTVKGVIIDKQSEQPLVGVTIQLLQVEPIIGAVTDENGRYAMEKVPIGRQAFRVSYLGYNAITLPNVLVGAGKEVVLDISLEESVVQIKEVVVSAAVEKDKANNDMAAVSARSFNLEEVNRYSGGRNDVARLAGNFAGVAAANDSRNDIVIRGNAPTGLLWRLEGIPIPNPNHFSTLGTTGGPVSALNPNLLRNSDFMTSAFPAEYGNALSGVFDVGFRSGNKDHHEYTVQLAAFSGLEVMAEGPLNKKHNGSYLVSFRNSFVQLANAVGIPTGTNSIPNYRDLSFKVDLGNSKLGRFSFFGIAGTSKIDFLGSKVDANDLFANPNEDAYARSGLAIVGMRHNLVVGKNAYWRTVVSFSSSGNRYDKDQLIGTDKTKPQAVTDVDDFTNTASLSSYYNRKFNARFTLRTGVLGQVFGVNSRVLDRENRPDLNEDGLPDWVTLRDFHGNIGLWQAFAQGQWRLGEKWTVNGGLHGQYLGISDKFALEPRLAMSWNFLPNQTLTLGYGLHNQMQPMPVFFYQEQVAPGVYQNLNRKLNFTRSNHFVLAYDRRFGTQWRLKAETYYQAIDHVPVQPISSSFSLLNAGADFVFPEAGTLSNKGKGRNYGVELTLEKFFSKGYYALLTGSLFDSKYTGSDGIERNTAFNNKYILNVLIGKEFKFGKDKRNAFTFDAKFATAGGKFFTPVDLAASQKANKEVLQDNIAFSERLPNYLKMNIKLGYRVNSKSRRMSQQFFVDLQNISNHKNLFVRRYNILNGQVNDVLQTGFFPDILYRVQF